MCGNIFQLSYNSEQIVRAWQLIEHAKYITLLTHSNADGDGASACAVLDHILKRLGKITETIYPDKPEFNYKRQASNLLIAKHNQQPDLIVACDVANYERVYWVKEFANVPLINIDHHINNSLNGELNFVNANASSACEELYVLLNNWNMSLIDSYVAQTILFGILYDSQIFHIQPLLPKTLKIAAHLMERGADLFALETELLSSKSHKIFGFWGRLLSDIKVDANGKVAWVCITQSLLQQNGLSLTSLIGFNNLLSQMCDIDVTILFYEKSDGTTKVSLRSRISDVNQFAKQFGGGGHKNAAGILSRKPVDEVVKDVITKVGLL